MIIDNHKPLTSNKSYLRMDKTATKEEREQRVEEILNEVLKLLI